MGPRNRVEGPEGSDGHPVQAELVLHLAPVNRPAIGDGGRQFNSKLVRVHHHAPRQRPFTDRTSERTGPNGRSPAPYLRKWKSGKVESGKVSGKCDHSPQCDNNPAETRTILTESGRHSTCFTVARGTMGTSRADTSVRVACPPILSSPSSDEGRPGSGGSAAESCERGAVELSRSAPGPLACRVPGKARNGVRRGGRVRRLAHVPSRRSH